MRSFRPLSTRPSHSSTDDLPGVATNNHVTEKAKPGCGSGVYNLPRCLVVCRARGRIAAGVVMSKGKSPAIVTEDGVNYFADGHRGAIDAALGHRDDAANLVPRVTDQHDNSFARMADNVWPGDPGNVRGSPKDYSVVRLAHPPSQLESSHNGGSLGRTYAWRSGEFLGVSARHGG